MHSIDTAQVEAAAQWRSCSPNYGLRPGDRGYSGLNYTDWRNETVPEDGRMKQLYYGNWSS